MRERWSKQDLATARLIMARDGTAEQKCAAIAKAIGRSRGAVSGMLSARGPSFGESKRRRRDNRKNRRPELKMFRHVVVEDAVNVPDDVLIERERRRDLAPRSLTAMLCGDPLPGYSALER